MRDLGQLALSDSDRQPLKDVDPLPTSRIRPGKPPALAIVGTSGTPHPHQAAHSLRRLGIENCPLGIAEGDDAGECKECIIVMSRLRPRRQTCRPGTPQQWHLEDVAEDRLGALSKGALEVRECILAVTGGRTITRHNLMLSSPTCVPAW